MAPPLESSEDALNAFDVGVEPDVVDAVPIRDDDVADLPDEVAVGDVGLDVTSLAEVEFALDRVDEREVLDARADEDPAE